MHAAIGAVKPFYDIDIEEKIYKLEQYSPVSEEVVGKLDGHPFVISIEIGLTFKF